MNTVSIPDSPRQSRIHVALLLAGLLGTASVGSALAGTITVSNTPFTGTSTDLTSVGDQTLPFTDGSGRTISLVSGTAEIYDNDGLWYEDDPVFDFTGLASGTTQIGFTILDYPTRYILSLTLSNGDIYNTAIEFTGTPTFYGFTDTQPFTSARLEIQSQSSGFMTDFRTAGTSVPEPASLALATPGVLLLGAAAWRRRRAG